MKTFVWVANKKLHFEDAIAYEWTNSAFYIVHVKDNVLSRIYLGYSEFLNFLWCF